MTENITIWAAFVGGVVAFFSPCVILLVPAFLAHIAGVSLQEKSKARGKVLANTLAFAGGFTLVFVALGAALGWLSSFFVEADIWIERVGGILIIFLGLVFLGVIKIGWFQAEHKVSAPKSKRAGWWQYLSSFAVGMVFSAGWTPCLTPILAAILVLATTSGSVAGGAWLLFFFSLGLMVPFLVAGIFLDWFTGNIRRFDKAFSLINKIAGVLLVIFGIILVTGYFSRTLSFLLNLF